MVDDRQRVGDQQQVGEGRQVAILGLDLDVKQPALGDAAELFVEPDEIAGSELPHDAQHDARHGVGDEGRGRQANDGGEDNTQQA